MPELPVIRAQAERLHDIFAGAVLEGADPLHFTGLKTVEPAPETLFGSVLTGVGSVGKYLVFDFGGSRMLVHLSQGGRIAIEDPPKRTRPKGGVLRLRFSDRASVLVKEFGTERKAAWWVLAEGDEGPLAVLGPEPGDEAFRTLVATSDDRRRVHTILRDQRTVAGIGRGHADDVLHHAKLSPMRSLGSLDVDERERLLEAIDECLADALVKERSRSGGLPPKLSEHFVVHGRWGAPCPVCATELARVSYEAYEVTYCPPCQTGGKLLADRRRSRFLR